MAKLIRIEERLSSPTHVFQTYWSVGGPKGQLKTKGGIENVPINIDSTVRNVSRALNDSHVIHGRPAKKFEYVKDYKSGVVRPKLLYDVARNFVKTPLLIELLSDWTEDWPSR